MRWTLNFLNVYLFFLSLKQKTKQLIKIHQVTVVYKYDVRFIGRLAKAKVKRIFK